MRDLGWAWFTIRITLMSAGVRIWTWSTWQMTMLVSCEENPQSLMHSVPDRACAKGLQVKYKEVMKQYNLGPNGGILTSLNLFATRFDQVQPPG